MASANCTICGATVVIERPMFDHEKQSFLCEDCFQDRAYEQRLHEDFINRELPKFKALLGEVEDGLVSVETFYSRMAEMVEPF